ncbi:CGNR zinc finger domain-containing protein [Herbidospora daliensis]|uniref:CGNR zinc finger domain-containing protein n=1 Tax=Herbidospora daliensis TaxID=295585 RepID=UPI0007816A5A|nr:CGNR zinc finger domain-containing protein [Herbidospora daliensis]
MKGQPGDREIAPGPLALVQSFVNSLNLEFGPDEFATTEAAGRWLARHGFTIEVGELDRRDAVTLREALRAVLRENNGAAPDREARLAIDHVARDCPLVLSGETLGLRPVQPDLRGVFATILGAVAAAVADGSWPRLKACREHRCEWAFYDRSRNRGSRWCSMAVCGTRAKMRTYRRGAADRAEFRAGDGADAGPVA